MEKKNNRGGNGSINNVEGYCYVSASQHSLDTSLPTFPLARVIPVTSSLTPAQPLTLLQTAVSSRTT